MAFGDALGGFVQQRNIGRQLAIGESQLAINENLLRLKQKQAEDDALVAQRESILDALNSNLEQIGKLRDTGTEEGLRAADLQMRRSKEAFGGTIQALESTGDRQDALLANLIRSGLENISAVSPTPQQQAAVTGESAAIQTTAEASGLVDLGADAAEVRETANLAPAPTDITVLEREREELIAAGDMEGALTRTNMIAKLAGGGQGNAALFEGDGGLKVSATNSLRAEIASIFGGFFDPVTGAISGLNKEDGIKATAIAAQAAEFLLTGEATTIPQAAAMAAAKFGIGVPQPVERERAIIAEAVATFNQLADRPNAEELQNRLIERLESQFAISEEKFREALGQ